MADRCRRTVLQRRRWRPLFQHRLDGDVEESRAFRGALGQFSGAGYRLIQGLRAGDAAAPLGEGFHQTVGPADNAQVAEPLGARVELRRFAIGGRLAGADKHRNFALVGPVNAHRALQHSNTGVEQHRLHPPGHTGVARCHRNGEGFVPAVDVCGAGPLFQLLSGQSLPYRRPLGAGRRDDVVNVQVSQGFENGIAAVQS